MKSAIISCTIAALTVHAGLGCCWHHAHGEATSGTAHRCEADDRQHCCHGAVDEDHGGELAAGSHGDGSCPAPLRCQERECVFTNAGERMLLESPFVSAWQPALTADAVPPLAGRERLASWSPAGALGDAAIYLVQGRLII